MVLWRIKESHNINEHPHVDVTYFRKHMDKAIISCIEIFHTKLS